MKKTKRFMAAVMSTAMMLACHSETAAAWTVPHKPGHESDVYSYNELIEMTDEQLSEIIDVPEFANDILSEEEKFRSSLNNPPSIFTGDNYESTDYAAYLFYLSGRSIPYMSFVADTDTPLDSEFDPAKYGYPSDWTVELVDDRNGVTHFYGYRVLIPVEIMTDYESYVRVVEGEKYATKALRSDNSYGVTQYYGLLFQFNSWGNQPAKIQGDANCDGKITVADAVAVLQYIANAEKYPMTEQAKFNADIDGEEGITGGDAKAIQMIDAGIWDET